MNTLMMQTSDVMRKAVNGSLMTYLDNCDISDRDKMEFLAQSIETVVEEYQKILLEEESIL